MAGPIHPRLLRRAKATRTFLIASVAVGVATAVLLILQARLLSDWITRAFAELAFPSGWQGALVALLAVFAGRAVIAWLSAVLAQRSAAEVKSTLRRDVLKARLATPVGGASSASLVRTLTQGLDSLDGYFSKYLPQLGLAATVPFIVGLAILFADWQSALIIVFTLPLLPASLPLVKNPPHPTARPLVPGWPPWRTRLEKLSDKVGRPVLFTELGYPSRLGAAEKPSQEGSGTISQPAQARLYEAAFKVWKDVSWFDGIWWWDWPGDGGDPGRDAGSYPPVGKLAQSTLTRWLRTAPEAAPATTPLPAATTSAPAPTAPVPTPPATTATPPATAPVATVTVTVTTPAPAPTG